MSDFCAHAYCSLILCFYCLWLCIWVTLTCLELRGLRSGYGNRPAFSSFEFLLLLLYIRATLVYIEVRDVQSFPLLLYSPLCSTFLLLYPVALACLQKLGSSEHFFANCLRFCSVVGFLSWSIFCFRVSPDLIALYACSFNTIKIKSGASNHEDILLC